MNKTLSVFMVMVFSTVILVSLYYGLTYQTLKLRNEQDTNAIDTYQIKPN
jgi:hypothetical protein